MEKKKIAGRYVLSQILGTGSFGKVFYSSPYAIKEILTTAEHYKSKLLENEIKIIKSLSHPNIVHTHEVVYYGNAVYIVMEYCETDLSKLIGQFVGKEDMARDALKQIVQGFKELNRQNIVHRDLKPANVLVSKGQLKLADFGLAKFVEQSENMMLKSWVGTPLYMSPQILKKGVYSPKCDIWSVGLVFYELLFGYLPWKGTTTEQLLENILTKPLVIPSGVSDETKLILTKTLAVEECDRWSWEQVFKVVLKPDQPQAPQAATARRFSYADLYKLLEIELKQVSCDTRSIVSLLNPNRKEQPSKQELQKLSQVVEKFAKEYRSFIYEFLRVA